MHAAALRIEVHIPDSSSLKDKRKVVRPFVEGLRRVASLSVSEVDHHDTWQRAAFGVAIAAPEAAELERLIARVRRYVDDQIEMSVVDVKLTYMEDLDG
jgi:hypothetical protein